MKNEYVVIIEAFQFQFFLLRVMVLLLPLFSVDDLTKKYQSTTAITATQSTRPTITTQSTTATQSTTQPTITTQSTTQPTTTTQSTTAITATQSTLPIKKGRGKSNKGQGESKNMTFILKGKDGTIVARGTVFRNRDIIHGRQRQKDCEIVTIDEVLQVGAEPWFDDAFGEGFDKGGMVEWPKDMMCSITDMSPMHTRTGKRR